MKLVEQLLVVAPLIAASMSWSALAGEHDPLSINLSTNNIKTVDRARHFGNIRLSKGHPLTVFRNLVKRTCRIPAVRLRG